MSTAVILNDAKQVEYNETQKYALLYDLIKLKRQIKLFGNNLQGIQVP